MSDNKMQNTAAPIGAPDRDHITADQTYEVEALMAKHHKTQKQVLDAIKKAGPLRVQIERALRK
jgi:hypothetical protein